MELKDDMLRGAKAIADFLGEEERRVFYMLERGQLHGFKRGGLWNARKSTLVKQIEKLEAAAAARDAAATHPVDREDANVLAAKSEDEEARAAKARAAARHSAA